MWVKYSWTCWRAGPGNVAIYAKNAWNSAFSVEAAASMAAAPPKPACGIQKVAKPGSTEQPDMKAF